MTPELFRAMLAHLGYRPTNAHELIGIGRKSCYRYCNGEAEPPMVVVRLLDMYRKFGIPEDHRPC